MTLQVTKHVVASWGPGRGPSVVIRDHDTPGGMELMRLTVAVSETRMAEEMRAIAHELNSAAYFMEHGRPEPRQVWPALEPPHADVTRLHSTRGYWELCGPDAWHLEGSPVANSVNFRTLYLAWAPLTAVPELPSDGCISQ